MANVFISYCRSKGASDLVRRIERRLDGMGISCWYDTQSMNLGGIGDFITKEIQDCAVFLLLWDQGANVSSYVLSEVATSFPLYRKQIMPIPVQIGRFDFDGNLSFYFKAYNILTYDSVEAVPVEELARKISQLLGKNPLRPRLTSKGYCGRGKQRESVTYTFHETGLFLISGFGPMRHYLEPENAPWHPKKENITSLRIESGVTSIGGRAFYDCKALANVQLPDSVESIEDFAFCGCEALRSVKIPGGVKSILFGAFEGCKNLISVHIPDSVTLIESRVFRDCIRLTSVSVPENAKIGYGAFDKYTHVARRPSP